MRDFILETNVARHLAVLAGERVFYREFKYGKRSEVFGEGEEAEYVYHIIYGAVRTHKLLSDGRRQVNSFHLQGDMFGFENGPVHRFSAEAVAETKARIRSRRSVLDTMSIRETGATNVLGLITRISSTPRTICCSWAGRQPWRGWPLFFSKWTNDRPIRM